MPEPLKNCYNSQFIAKLCADISAVYPKFAQQKFTTFIFDKHWQDRELKARMRHIALGLGQFLTNDYQLNTNILKQIRPTSSSFEYMFLPDFVEVFGLEDYQVSIDVLAIFTSYASAEFAIRAFIKRYPVQTMQQLQKWAKSEHKHLRRLASEGCRPRLPWACALPAFKKDPSVILPILSILKNDSSEYVRRSVANNLNDISKDNPNIVINIAKKWFGKTPATDKLIKHGVRTLLKQAQPDIMALFGFLPAQHITIDKFQVSKTVKIGQSLCFSFMLNSTQILGKLRIEYAIDFMKNNGSLARKIFKISETDNKKIHKIIKRKHSFKLISTRKYYQGIHNISIIINGVSMADKVFLLR